MTRGIQKTNEKTTTDRSHLVIGQGGPGGVPLEMFPRARVLVWVLVGTKIKGHGHVRCPCWWPSTPADGP